MFSRTCKTARKAGCTFSQHDSNAFGVYGKRWLDSEPEYRKYINEYWIRPDKMRNHRERIE